MTSSTSWRVCSMGATVEIPPIETEQELEAFRELSHAKQAQLQDRRREARMANLRSNGRILVKKDVNLKLDERTAREHADLREHIESRIRHTHTKVARLAGDLGAPDGSWKFNNDTDSQMLYLDITTPMPELGFAAPAGDDPPWVLGNLIRGLCELDDPHTAVEIAAAQLDLGREHNERAIRDLDGSFEHPGTGFGDAFARHILRIHTADYDAAGGSHDFLLATLREYAYELEAANWHFASFQASLTFRERMKGDEQVQ